MSWLVADLPRCILKDATVEVNPALVEGYSSCAQLKVCGTVCWAKHVGAEAAAEVTESWQQFISTLLKK
jgi:hypothetical protein